MADINDLVDQLYQRAGVEPSTSPEDLAGQIWDQAMAPQVRRARPLPQPVPVQQAPQVEQQPAPAQPPKLSFGQDDEVIQPPPQGGMTFGADDEVVKPPPASIGRKPVRVPTAKPPAPPWETPPEQPVTAPSAPSATVRGTLETAAGLAKMASPGAIAADALTNALKPKPPGLPAAPELNAPSALTPWDAALQKPAAPNAPAPTVMPGQSPGFVPTVAEALTRGVKEGGQETAEAFGDWHEKPAAPPDNSYVGQLLGTKLSQGWKNPDWVAAQIAYGLGKSSPSLALGLGGGAAGGSVAGTGGALAGSIAGFAIGGGLQELMPAYQRARADGLDHDAAVNRAWKESAVAAAFGAAMGAVPGIGASAERTAKQVVGRMLLDMGVTIPAIGAAHEVTRAGIEGKPLSVEDMLQSYLLNVGTGAALVGGHHAISSAVKGARDADATTGPGARPAGPDGPSTPDEMADFLRRAEATKPPPGEPGPEPAKPRDPRDDVRDFIRDRVPGIDEAAVEAMVSRMTDADVQKALDEIAAHRAKQGARDNQTAGNGKPEAESVKPEAESVKQPPRNEFEDASEILRRYGYDDEQIGSMSPAQRTAELADAKAALGIEEPVNPAETAKPAASEAQTAKPNSDQSSGNSEQSREVALTFGHDDPVVGTRGVPAQSLEHATRAAGADYTPAQGEANNRQLGHMKWQGLRLSIETPAGGVRKGVDQQSGQPWETTMGAAYGYIRGTKGADGMHVDVFMGPHPENPTVHVINEVDRDTGKFRQVKAMIGFPTEQAARDAYLATSSKSPETLGDVVSVPVDDFKGWLRTEDTTKPFPTTHTTVRARAPARPKETMSLLQMIAFHGGLKPDGETRALGMSSRNRVLIPGVGNRSVIRGAGMTMDDLAERMVEHGFLPPYNPNEAGNLGTHNEIRDMLDRELRGQRVMPMGAAGEQTAREREIAEESHQQQLEQVEANHQEVRNWLTEQGERPDDVAYYERAGILRKVAEHMALKGTTVEEAWEQAVMETAIDDGHLTPDQVDDIFGEGKADDVQRAAQLPEGSEHGEGAGHEVGIPFDGAPREGARIEDAAAAAPGAGEGTLPATRPAEADGQEGPRPQGLTFGHDDEVITPANLPAKTMTLEVGGKRYPISDYKEASDMVSEARDAAGIGGSQFPTPIIYDENGEPIGHVSYNGRVWPGAPRDWKPGTKPLYDNGTGLENSRKRIEQTAAGEQHVLPGTERISEGEQAQRKAEQPLKPKVAQKPADEGLFGDEGAQSDLVDQARSSQGRDVEAIREYARSIVGEDVKSVSLIGSVARNGKGNDVDLLYDLGEHSLPTDSSEAADAVRRLIEEDDRIDLDSYDSFFKVGDRYFHLSSGAGRAIVENTDYAKQQAGKPVKELAHAKPPPEAASPPSKTESGPVEPRPEGGASALEEAPTWAQVLHALPKTSAGHPDVDAAFRIMTDITGMKKPAFRKLSAAEQIELYRRVQAGEFVKPEAATPDIKLADALLARLNAGKPITNKVAQDEAAQAFGGRLADGKFDRKDMADAIELALNMHVKETRHLRVDSPDPRHAIRMLSDLLEHLPTQRVRTDEMVRFQQFSTPPNYAAVAAYVANLRKGDVMLEPSAGTGSLVAAASMPGVRIFANELSDRRAALLRHLIGKDGQVFTENAEQFDNILPADVKPTVVMMNPPFSQTAGRMGDKRDVTVAAKHIEQGLARLEPGGRLVAIVGEGMTLGAPRHRGWFDRIGQEYAIRANIGVAGKVYEKYGTTFGTRLLVFDKVPPDGSKPVTADVSSVDDLMKVLEPIRDGRPEQRQPEQGSGSAAAPRDGGRAAASPEPAQPGPVGSGGEGGGRLAGEGPGGVAPTGGEPGRVEAGERAGVAPEQPERGTGERAAGGPVEGDRASTKRVASGRAGAERDLQPPSGGQPEPPASGERVELENAAPASQKATEGLSDSLYDHYEPRRAKVKGAKPHPGPLVESAAMASVDPPEATYKPNLPPDVISKGLLSTAQLEPVIYAGQAHTKMLPAGEGETPRRKGYFIGDGTGVGKGREVAGIILDNWSQGRSKHVWVSEKRTLLQDAKRDWKGLGQDPSHVFDLGKVKAGEPITAGKGIGFTTYDTLKGGLSDQAAIARGGFVRGEKVRVIEGAAGVGEIAGRGVTRRGSVYYPVRLDGGATVETLAGHMERLEETRAVKSRVDQIVDWLGKDFDGVIAFDEAHNMGNAAATRGERGIKDAAQKALAGLELQSRLPNARVVYVSATGATEVSNLAYADRLGLWGRGTPFASRDKFVEEVAGGGIAAMELVARDMKQLGVDTARNLSYDGVEYRRIEHKLDDNQRDIYDTLAEAWQNVLNNINAALVKTGGAKDSRAKSAAMSAFWGGHQRFFNQIVTSMQMPSVIKAVEQDLRDGRQAVLQLTNTNEASQERAAAKAESAEAIEDLDITPRDQIIQLVERSFPTQQYERYVDENGRERARPVVDREGNPVQNREAVRMREELIDKLASIRVPQGPLDMILDHFGTDVVAEVTGRGRRFVMKTDEKGQRRRVEESRPGSANLAETDAFQSGSKKVLVFSDAGGTGRSYHADNTSASKGARRSHYLVQGGWRADKAVQGFGRTHRTNQASAPIVSLVTTDLQGQKRFISSIARRLAQLGALTKGQRQAGDQGIFSARDNLESTEASHALEQFFRRVIAGDIEGVPVAEFERQTGLKLRNTDDEGRSSGMAAELPPITQFLNRLLSLKIDMQNRVFDAFSHQLDTVIEARSQAGLLDAGLETVRADKIEKALEKAVHTDPESGAQTSYAKFRLSNRFKPIKFDDVANSALRPIKFWVRSERGKVYGVAEAPSLTDAKGNIVDQYRIINPASGGRIQASRTIDGYGSKWQKVSKADAEKLWQAEIERAPEFITRDEHLITGAILPVWDRIKGSTRVVRLQTDEGERFIGRVVGRDQIADTLQRLGAEGEQQKVEPADLYKHIMQGGRAELANGWTLSRRLVAGEQRIELKGPSSFSEGQQIERDGLFSERINYEKRYFVPASETEGPEVLRRLTQFRPVTRMGEVPEEVAQSVQRLTQRAAAEHRQLAHDIKMAINQVAGWDPAVRAEIVDRIEGELHPDWGKAQEGAAVAGQYNYAKDLITVATANGADAIRTAYHEGWHAIESVLAPEERALLARETPRLRDFIARYGNLPRETTEQMAEREVHAEAAATYTRLRDSDAPPNGLHIAVRRILEKLYELFARIKNALKGRGFEAAEDIFADFRKGEMARRRERANVPPADDIAQSITMPRPVRDIRDAIAERIAPIGRKANEGIYDLTAPTKRLQNELEARRGSAFPDPLNMHVKKRLFPGLRSYEVDEFNKRYLDPMVEELQHAGISLPDAGLYLYAKHAHERNERIAEINTDMPDGGSGMTTEQARATVDRYESGPQGDAYRQLSGRVAAIREFTLQAYERYGLETPATVRAWRDQYQDYVPLKGWEDAPDDAPPDYRPGPGFNVRGKEVHPALGRRSRADNPLVNMIDQAYRTIDRGERNRFLQSMHLALASLGPEAADIATRNRGAPRRVLNPATGLVRTIDPSPHVGAPQTVSLKIGGNPVHWVFRSVAQAEAIKRMSPDGLGMFQGLLTLQNKLKAIWTHYSPDFLVRHFLFRYPIEGTLNSFEQKESGDHSILRYIKEAQPLFGDAVRAIFARNAGRDGGELGRYWDEMRRHGGAMTFRQMRDVDMTREHLKTQLMALKGHPDLTVRQKWRKGIEAMDVVTNALDNALRLAAYASARRQGKTPQQAALIAREATVDFQLKGKWANIIGLFAPFASVANATAARMVKALGRSRMMRRVFMGTMAAGFLTAMFNYLVGGNDKDGIPFFDKLPEWDKRLNLIIINPFDRDEKGRPIPIKIPMPYNWALPLAMGYGFGNAIFGTLGVGKSINLMTHALMESLTPFGSEHDKFAYAVPELLRPGYHVITNQKFSGAPVHIPSDMANARFGKNRQTGPNAYTSWQRPTQEQQVGKGYEYTARFMNNVTGGSASKSGMLDMYPEDYKELIGYAIGTPLRFGQEVMSTAGSIAKGEAPKSTMIPLARVFRGADYDAADRQRGFEAGRAQRQPWHSH